MKLRGSGSDKQGKGSNMHPYLGVDLPRHAGSDEKQSVRVLNDRSACAVEFKTATMKWLLNFTGMGWKWDRAQAKIESQGSRI